MVLDGISENMASLAQLGMYGAINTDDNTTNGFYVIKFLSNTYKIKSNKKIDGQVIYAGELVVKAQYLCSMQENTKLVLETTTTLTDHYIPNTHNTSSTS